MLHDAGHSLPTVIGRVKAHGTYFFFPLDTPHPSYNNTTKIRSWDEANSALTMDSSYLGLIKAHNDFEVLNDGSVDQIAMERTYTITGETLNYYCGGENVDAKEMTAVIDYGGGIWTFRYIISECEHNIGCMDPLATNYDPEATRCDGHCLYVVLERAAREFSSYCSRMLRISLYHSHVNVNKTQVLRLHRLASDQLQRIGSR